MTAALLWTPAGPALADDHFAAGEPDRVAALAPPEVGYATEAATLLREHASEHARVVMGLPFATPFVVQAVEADWLKVCLEVPDDAQCGYVPASAACRRPEEARDQARIDDVARRAVDLVGDDEEYLEGLEQLLYFQPERASLAQRLWAIELQRQRMRYDGTPLEVLQRSKQYGSIPASSYSEGEPGTPGHVIRLPRTRASFFEKIYPLDFGTFERGGDGSWVVSPGGTLFARLLRIYFPRGNDLHLVREAGSARISYQSGPVPFFRIGKEGMLEPHTLRLSWSDEDALRFLEISPPIEEGQAELLFSREELRGRLEGPVRVSYRRRAFTVPSGPGVSSRWAQTAELDLDRDGAPDLVISEEECPDGPGDTSDLVHAYNLGGSWVRELAKGGPCYGPGGVSGGLPAVRAFAKRWPRARQLAKGRVLTGLREQLRTACVSPDGSRLILETSPRLLLPGLPASDESRLVVVDGPDGRIWTAASCGMLADCEHVQWRPDGGAAALTCLADWTTPATFIDLQHHSSYRFEGHPEPSPGFGHVAHVASECMRWRGKDTLVPAGQEPVHCGGELQLDRGTRVWGEDREDGARPADVRWTSESRLTFCGLANDGVEAGELYEMRLEAGGKVTVENTRAPCKPPWARRR